MSILSSSPVSSPTSIMLTTMSSQTLLSPRGGAMGSPSRTPSCTLCMAPASTELPEVSREMLSASRMGTPAPIRVPKVRVNRAMAALLIMEPKTGMRNLSQSTTKRPTFVAVISL